MSSFAAKTAGMFFLSVFLLSAPLVSLDGNSLAPEAGWNIAWAQEPQESGECKECEEINSDKVCDAVKAIGNEIPFDIDDFQGEIKDATIKEMIKWLEGSAEEGNQAAQFLFGIINLCGDDEYGVAENEQKALFWLEKSAEQNNPISQFIVAVKHLADAKTKEEAQAAIELMQQSGEIGGTLMVAALSESEEDSAMAEEYLKKAIGNWLFTEAEQGDSAAQFFLGVFLHDGDEDFGIEQDAAKSLEWLKIAAESDNSLAQFLIGTLCIDNEGTELQPEEAPAWFLKSAQAGFAPAQFFMGLCCENGFGVEKNMQEAKSWYEKASVQDFQSARQALENLSE